MLLIKFKKIIAKLGNVYLLILFFKFTNVENKNINNQVILFNCVNVLEKCIFWELKMYKHKFIH